MSDWLSRLAALNRCDQPVHRVVDQVRDERRYEVRCCCDPCKLLGTVPVRPFTRVKPYEAVVFELRPAPGAPDTTRVPEQLRLTFLRWDRPGHEFNGLVIDPGEHGYAFKSDDTPIETLRRIVGWRDAP